MIAWLTSGRYSISYRINVAISAVSLRNYNTNNPTQFSRAAFSISRMELRPCRPSPTTRHHSRSRNAAPFLDLFLRLTVICSPCLASYLFGNARRERRAIGVINLLRNFTRLERDSAQRNLSLRPDRSASIQIDNLPRRIFITYELMCVRNEFVTFHVSLIFCPRTFREHFTADDAETVRTPYNTARCIKKHPPP